MYIKNKKTTSFSRFPSYFSACKPSLQEKKREKKKETQHVRFETSYTLRVLRLAHNTTAEDIVELLLTNVISDNQISSAYSAKTTDNRLEIKLAYATPFELQGKQEISLKKIFGGSQILTINATKFAGLDEIPVYSFACWNLKPAKLWSCFCLSFAWFCAHLTIFAERYASESFY